MPRRLIKDAAAEHDLIGIWLYTLRNWSEARADRYVDELETGICKLLIEPEKGDDRSTLREGYWSMKVESHVVYYTFDERVLRLRRVLHAAMDADCHL